MRGSIRRGKLFFFFVPTIKVITRKSPNTTPRTKQRMEEHPKYASAIKKKENKYFKKRLE
jgi:hypothetical protein